MFDLRESSKASQAEPAGANLGGGSRSENPERRHEERCNRQCHRVHGGYRAQLHHHRGLAICHVETAVDDGEGTAIHHRKGQLVWDVCRLSISRNGSSITSSPSLLTEFSSYALISKSLPRRESISGELYELDGDRAGPISHGASSPATLLENRRIRRCLK